ncbi:MULTISPECIES: Cof-type HAD-IIB family hydrolase [Bacillaceae]|uniref:Cof-type HAD-IIB family hydrolase n=1 Tax=Evansella alkalicola TaxID=745819 RepID=A0ABS6JN41_9BACI|nr:MULTISPECIES: Cof-type HAD-IIB family hydrolase [Bacillaceae]MBU9719976.1 Cof-type HAD-IIB family hydrolase [Bacillus alkalicola]
MNKQYKLIALDMDGTLLNDQHAVPEENALAIKEAQEKGIHVVLSTGRSLASCREYAQALKLSSYLVTVNGSEIYDEHGELIEQNPIQADYIQMMWDLRNEHKTGYWAVSENKVWNNTDDLTDIPSHQWLKFGFDIEDNKVRETILEHLSKNKDLEISNSSPTNLEVNAVGVNKAVALTKVCERLEITMDEVIAMGDSLNDLAMITEAGFGVAMGNAQDKVKDAANWVTDTNNNAGVGKAIRKWVL